MTTAWIFCGGGSFGSIHVGVAEALLADGIVPDLLIGTSIGAINAALLASDASPRGAALLREAWLSARRCDLVPIRPMTVLGGLLRLDNHLVGNDRLGRWLRDMVPYELIEDSPVPLMVTASDLAAAEPVHLERGDVVESVLASSAAPGVLPPVNISGRWLVDGWFLANAPLGWAAARGADTVYVLPCGGDQLYRRTTRRPPVSMWATSAARRTRALIERGLPNGDAAINQALMGAVVANRVRQEFLAWTPWIDVYLPPAPSVAGLSMYSFAETRGLMDAAYRATARWLEDARPLTPEDAARSDALAGVAD